MSGTVGIVGGTGQELEDLLPKIGLRPIVLTTDHLSSPSRIASAPPDAVLIDVRKDPAILSIVPALKRRYPATGVAVVASVLEPALMLDAMRAGVNEVIAEPITEASLQAALSRLIVPKSDPTQGRLFAIIGAKGGVGATTIAVNFAEALARTLNESLLVDLNVGTADSSVLLGVEPRFSVVEALENTHRLDHTFFKSLLTRTRSGMELLGSSGRVVQGAIDPQRVRTLLEFLGSYSKAVVLDIPRQDLGLLESLDAASAIFVVVNQELPTVKNAQPLVKRLQQRYGERVAMMVNRSDRNSEISLDDITKAVGAPTRHVFPNDYRQAMSAANKGQPIASSNQGRLAESFYALAGSLVGGGTDKREADESGRLFGWLSSRK